MLTITGLMRSGTSLAAKTASELGIVMGTSMVMPWAGAHPEYEDLALAGPLTAYALGFESAPLEELFDTYVIERERHFEQVQATFTATGWGFKSPLLMLDWSAWMDAVDEPHVRVVMDRNFDATLDSLKRSADRLGSASYEAMVRVQERLTEVLWEAQKDADFLLSFEEIQRDPVGAMTPAVERLREVT